MILNDDNKAQVVSVVTQAMTNRRVIEYAEDQLKSLRASVEMYETTLREAERERNRYNREIKALGFHDIGHARTELAQEEKNATHLRLSE